MNFLRSHQGPLSASHYKDYGHIWLPIVIKKVGKCALGKLLYFQPTVCFVTLKKKEEWKLEQKLFLSITGHHKSSFQQFLI
jgi:hypothetical protein